MTQAQNGEPLSLQSYAVLSNVEISVTAELDHRKITFRDLLLLELDSVLVLGRPVGENIDVYVDRVLLGTAEILVVDDSLAVRVADLRDKSSGGQGTELVPAAN
jgi:flagellar motor switch protein FliN